MNEIRIIPEEKRFLSGSMLKLIAVVTMAIDHSAAAFLYGSSIRVLTIGGFTLTLYNLMRSIGRLAFPIFCFLLVEGILHTRNKVRYGISLAAFALISEIPWNLMHEGTLLYGKQNVFFTLLAGFLGVCAIIRFGNQPLLQFAALFPLLAFSMFAKIDYDASGYVLIIVMYALRENAVARSVAGFFILPSKWIGALAFIPIAFYNGKRGFIKGKILKYAFYAFYPVHMLVIYIIKYIVLKK